MNKKLFASLLVGILFSGFALYVTFKNIPLMELAEYIGTIDLRWALPSFFFIIISFVMRVIRWQVILSPLKNRTSFWSAFHPLMMGFMINCVLPGRVGEVARPVAFSKKEGVPFTRVFATVGAERFFDLITILILFIFVMIRVSVDPAIEVAFGKYELNKDTLNLIFIATVQISVALTALIFLTAINRTRRVINNCILAIPNYLFFLKAKQKNAIREKVFKNIVDVLNNIALGFEVVKSFRNVIYCFFLSFMVWLTIALSFYAMMFGCPGIQVTFPQMLTVVVLICFFVSLPSVPGYWGLFEAGGVFGLLIFGVPAKESAGFILTNHVIQLIPVMIIGIVSGLIIGMKETVKMDQGPFK